MACGIVLAVMTAFVIFGGAKRISVITSIIVPIMAFAYIAIAVWTTVSNIGILPEVFGMVFASAFDFQSIFGGFAGSVVMLGIKRGLYSNEAGMGSAPNAAATASACRTLASRASCRACPCTSTRCSSARARP